MTIWEKETWAGPDGNQVVIEYTDGRVMVEHRLMRALMIRAGYTLAEMEGRSTP